MAQRWWIAGPWLLFLALWAGGSTIAVAEQIALVIGNNQYRHAPYLNNPARDAEALAQLFAKIGFRVTGPLRDLKKSEMDEALRQFGRQARNATAAVMYFSGHGVEVKGQNYLLPVDAALERESDASLEAVALDVVLDQISGAQKYRLVILDACRDNPLANAMQRFSATRSAGFCPARRGRSEAVGFKLPRVSGAAGSDAAEVSSWVH